MWDSIKYFLTYKFFSNASAVVFPPYVMIGLVEPQDARLREVKQKSLLEENKMLLCQQKPNEDLAKHEQEHEEQTKTEETAQILKIN